MTNEHIGYGEKKWVVIVMVRIQYGIRLFDREYVV